MSSNIGAGFSRVRLRRLRGRDLSVLLDAILPIEARLKERVAWLSQGNPLHAIQIVQYMEDEQTLVRDNGHWRLKSGTPREIDLPPDLMDMVALRLRKSIQTNDPSLKLEQTANWLAILGIRVPTQLIGQVVAHTENLDDAAFARNIAILRRFGVVHERTYRQLQCLEFDNSLVREAILNQLSTRPEHASMHRQAAAEKVVFYERIQQNAPMLEIAEHWRLAGDDERYQNALFGAAERSLHQGDPRGARDQFRELLMLLEQRDERTAQWAAAQLALADLARRFGKFGQAEDAYRQLLGSELLSGTKLSRAARGLAHLLFTMGRYDEAVEHYTDALETATTDDDTSSVIKALIGLSRSYLRKGELTDGQRVRQRLESVLESLNTGALSGRVLLHLAEAAKRMGQVKQRADYLERALTHYQHSRDKQGLANAQVGLASMLMEPAERWPERTAEASRLLREALEIRRALGDRQGVAEIFRYLGDLDKQLGDLEASENYLYQSLRMLEALGAPFDLGAVHNSLAVTKMWMGSYDEAMRHFDEAERLFASIGDQLAVSHVHVNKGITELNQLHWARAAEILEDTRTSKEAFDSTWGLFNLYINLAIIKLQRGDFAQALELINLTLEGGAPDEARVAARSMLGLVQC
ncbi:MAG: tetratricopeptide repeat protein, partial [Myxococcota bacterium]